MRAHNKKIIFRVDAAEHIGTGHLQRCLTLARELSNIGFTPVFVMIPFDDRFISLVSNHSFDYILMRNPNYDLIQTNDSSKWIGRSESADADEFLLLTEDLQASWCVVDHYSLSSVWERAVRQRFNKTLVIDDLADRDHECDLLLDQNYWSDFSTRYDNRVNESCLKFLGPKYALLREEFRAYRQKVLNSQSLSNHILINFGGVGNYRLLSKIASVIPSFTCRYEFTVITGKVAPTELEILKEKLNHEKIYVMESSNNMAELMFNSDYAFGACGSTVWERFCLGLNSGLVEVAQNQHKLIHTLSDQLLIDNLGSISDFTVEKLRSFMEILDFNDLKYIKRKSRIMSLVDGEGAVRVATKIKELSDV